MILMLTTISAFLLVLLVVALWDLRHEKKTVKFLDGELQEAVAEGLRLSQQLRDSMDTIKDLEEQLAAKRVRITAEGIVTEVAPRRLRTRRSLSEQVMLEAMKHNTRQEKFVDTVKQIEKIGIQHLQPKERS